MKKTIDVAAIVGQRLMTLDAAAALYRMIEESKEAEIDLDFVNVHSINRDFANEYLARKDICSKLVSETNLSVWIRKVFEEYAANRIAPKAFPASL